MTLADFETMLKRHDWLYFMAEGNAYSRGKRSSEAIALALRQFLNGPDAVEAQRLFDAYAEEGKIEWL